MRPYFAILKDSFREALASRVLWFLLIISFTILFALTGFSLTERAAAHFFMTDVLNPQELITTWQKESRQNSNSPGAHIWNLIDEKRRAGLVEQVANNVPQEKLVEPVQRALNGLLKERTLYKPGLWKTDLMGSELQSLLTDGPASLSTYELERFNRLLLEGAYPQWLSAGRDRELHITYFGLDVPTRTLPILRRDYMIRLAVSIISTFFLGFMGIFSGLIVTAGIIPQAFEPGSVDLLLSKPIHRVGLYLTKFAGGCSFILLTAVILLGGLWLMVGLRHDVWIPNLLLCIPVYLFWFMVFYSFSAFIGLIWKNAIVAIATTICFWGVCALLTLVKNVIFESIILDPSRMTRIISTEKQLFAANDTSQIFQWNDESNHWDEIMVPDNQQQWQSGSSGLPAGPVWNGEKSELLAVQRSRRRWDLMFGQSTPVVYGKPSDQFRRHESIAAPTGTEFMFIDSKQRIVCVGIGGIYALQGSLESGTATNKPSVFGITIPIPGVGSKSEFQLISPPQRYVAPMAIAYDPKTERVAVFQREQLQLFQLDDKRKYQELNSQKVRDHDLALTAFCGDKILLGYDDGYVEQFDSVTLGSRGSELLEAGVPPRTMETSPDGRYCAVVLHDRTMWMFDAEKNEWSKPTVRGQGDISAAAWDTSNSLYLADQWHRVTSYDVAKKMQITRTVQNPMHWTEAFDYYLLRPTYAVLPKPGEIKNWVSFLLTDEKTILIGPNSAGLRSQRMPIDVQGPLISHSIFLLVMLGLGCLYIQRTDY